MSFVHRPTIRRTAVAVLLAVVVISASGTAGAGPGCLAPPVAAPVAVPFQAPPCRWCRGQRGLEYANRSGVPVRAAGSGTVVFAGQVAGVVWVTIDHGGGVRSSYGPLRRVVVRRGATVGPGTVLANSAGPVHFGVRIDGRYVDPAGLLGRPVHLVPRLFSPTARVPQPPAVRCGSSSPFQFAARSR